MTIKELKEHLNKFPEDMDVFVKQTNDEYEYSLVESVFVHDVEFEDSDVLEKEGELPKEDCVIISDELF